VDHDLIDRVLDDVEYRVAAAKMSAADARAVLREIADQIEAMADEWEDE
jgi:hypothetical protein